MTEQKTIVWTRPMLERFKRDYRKAKEEGKDQFTWVVDPETGETVEFVTVYARYLILYLDSKLLWGH